MFDLGKIIGVVIAAVIGMVGLCFVLSLVLAVPVWLLWNWLCPTIWDWPELGLLQAWGLTILCSFLFKSSSSSSKS